MSAVAEQLSARAAAARLLSLGLSAPDEETIGQAAALAAALEPGAADAWREALAALREALEGADAAELALEFEEIFGGEVRVPPYEASYLRGAMQKTRAIADIAGFYGAYGAAAEGSAGERPDHAGCQLEFLAFAFLRRLSAVESGDDEAASVCLAAEDDFLRDHAGRWLGTFSAELEQAAPSPFYVALAGLARSFVGDELARRGIEAEPVEPRYRSRVEPESFACGGCPAAEAPDETS